VDISVFRVAYKIIYTSCNSDGRWIEIIITSTEMLKSPMPARLLSDDTEYSSEKSIQVYHNYMTISYVNARDVDKVRATSNPKKS